MKTLLLVLAFVLASPAKAQLDTGFAFGITSTLLECSHSANGYLCTFNDGLVLLIDDEFTSYSEYRIPGSSPQGPVGQGPLPTLTTAWKDKLGVTHTVSTPIPSTTPAGLAKATQLHNSLVTLLQGLHPPAPVPNP